MEQHVTSSTGFLEQAVAQYQSDLKDCSAAIDYLQRRGLDGQAALTARLGAVLNPLPGHEQFTGMLAIPYLTPSGPVGLKFRRLDGGSPKYTAPLGQKTRLYNVLAVTQASDAIAICEGEFDTMVLHHMCGVPAIGVSGANNWKPHYGRVFRGFQTILIVSDNDAKQDGANPGQEMAARIISDLPHARNILLPAGSDLNEVYLAEGREAVLQRLGVRAPN